jgi:hypothetical protein
MFTNSKGFSAVSVEGLARHFDTSAMSYERGATDIKTDPHNCTDTFQ